jgi:hypothetical protein
MEALRFLRQNSADRNTEATALQYVQPFCIRDYSQPFHQRRPISIKICWWLAVPIGVRGF